MTRASQSSADLTHATYPTSLSLFSLHHLQIKLDLSIQIPQCNTSNRTRSPTPHLETIALHICCVAVAALCSDVAGALTLPKPLLLRPRTARGSPCCSRRPRRNDTSTGRACACAEHQSYSPRVACTRGACVPACVGRWHRGALCVR